MKKKPELYLVGPRVGMPSLDDLIELTRRLTGREPTAEEIEAGRRKLEAASGSTLGNA
jgi:hypothetical protein